MSLDLTTFTEVDPASDITLATNLLTVTTLDNNTTAYAYKDYGASYFSGSYVIRGKLNVNGLVGAANDRAQVFALTNTLSHANTTNDAHSIDIALITTSTYALYAREATGGATFAGSNFSSGSSTLNKNTEYWIEFKRDVSVGTFGTLYVRIFSESTYTTQVGSDLTITLHDNGTPNNAAFRYLYIVQSLNNTTSTRDVSFTLADVTVNSHDFVSAAVSGSATSSGTLSVSRPHALVSAASAQSASSSGTFLKSFPGSHDIVVSAISGHAAVLADFTKISGKVLISAAVAGSATSAATMALTRAPSVFISKFDTLIGTAKIQLLRVRDLTTYDSSDSTYKASPTLANAQMTMTQVNATLWPTYYSKSVDTTNWTDGEYMTHSVDSSDSTNYRFDSYIYKNGALYYGGLLSDERAAVFSSAAQSGLLTDAEHNQLMSLSTAADTSTAVWSDASALRILRTLTNKHVLNPADGTIKIYDDSGNLAYSGLAYSNAAGTVLYDGTAAVHHTTRLT